eukprot:Platyproteum_vivax@DN6242_c0_g1_i2.p1
MVFESYVSGEYAAKVKTYEDLNTTIDPEKTPFISKYAARKVIAEILLDLKGFLNRTTSSEDWDDEVDYPKCINMAARCFLKLGKNFIDTEEIASGEAYMKKALHLFLHGKNRVDQFGVIQETLNHLGMIWCNRGQFEKGLNYLSRAQYMYLHRKDLDTDTVHKHYTITLFYLAQAYAGKKVTSLASKYCSETLNRQLHYKKEPLMMFNLKEWIRNCTGLSDYFLNKGCVWSAEYCLVTGVVAVTGVTSDELGYNMEEFLAELWRDLGHVYLSRLQYSHELLQSPLTHAEKWQRDEGPPPIFTSDLLEFEELILERKMKEATEEKTNEVLKQKDEEKEEKEEAIARGREVPPEPDIETVKKEDEKKMEEYKMSTKEFFEILLWDVWKPKEAIVWDEMFPEKVTIKDEEELGEHIIENKYCEDVATPHSSPPERGCSSRTSSIFCRLSPTVAKMQGFNHDFFKQAEIPKNLLIQMPHMVENPSCLAVAWGLPQAKELFRLCLTLHDRCLKVFTLDSFATDHSKMELHLSSCYRTLSYFEDDLERIVAVLLRRVKLLSIVAVELNPQHFLALCRGLNFECGEIAAELAEIKLSNSLAVMYGSHINSPQIKKPEKDPKSAFKVQKYAAESFQFFKTYVDLHIKRGSTDPNEYEIDPDDLGHFSCARFSMASQIGKIAGCQPDRNLRIQGLYKQLEEYETIVRWLQKSNVKENRLERELHMAREMVSLLPVKISQAKQGI